MKLYKPEGVFLRAEIELLKEFSAHAIQKYVGQVKLRSTFGDIISLKARLEDLQRKIRESPPNSYYNPTKGRITELGPMKLRKTSGDVKTAKDSLEAIQSKNHNSSQEGLHCLVEERDKVRDSLRSLVQHLYPWVREGLYEIDEAAHTFKVKLGNRLSHLGMNDASVVQHECTDDFQEFQLLATQAGKYVENYNLRLDQEGRSPEQRSKQAVERVKERITQLGLGDAFSVAYFQPEKAEELKPELLELQNALKEEIQVLRVDTLNEEVPKILQAISSALHRVESTVGNATFDKTTCTISSREILEIHDYVRLGSNRPNVSSIRQIYENLEKSRNAKDGLRRAKESLNAAFTEKKKAFYKGEIEDHERILAEGDPVELSKVLRHKLAEFLQHAQEHYPELLKDKVCLENLRLTSEGLLDVARSDLLLANISIQDFQPVGEPLASRGGKTVQMVLDNAAKTLVLKQFQLADSSQSKTFYRQVANLGNVVSQHVIHLIGAFVDSSHGLSRGCILMPFYEQGDLAKWIKDHPHENKAMRDRLATGLLIGVADLHAHGIVHCDIKPENIFLTSNGTPLLGDFDGIKQANCTATYTSLQATPRYIAPELRSGPVRKFETAMDMFSVGIVLKELYPEPTAAIQALIDALISLDPGQRPSAREVLQHEAFGVPDVPVGQCLVCRERKPLSEGTSCERGHFLCRDCVADSVEHASKLQTSVTVDADGTMKCMSHGCDGRISGQEITRVAPTALKHLLQIAQMAAEIKATSQNKEKIEKLTSELLKKGGLDSDVERHLTHIQEKILNTCCPNCGACFDGFDDCCALKCESAGCGHHFCAWCLEYSSEDSDACHRHVRTCSKKLGEDPFFPNSFEQVCGAWRLLRAERLRKYWNENILNRNLPDALRRQLEPLLTPDIVGSRFRLR